MRAKGLFLGRSAGELRERGAQWWAAWLERLDLSSLTRLPTDADVPASPTDSQLWPRSLPSPSNYRRFLERRGPSAARDLMAAADGILAGKLSLLGFRDVPLGSPVDWHRDPVAGTTSPRLHWSRIAYLDPAVASDHKVVWEINRHQWFLTLGRAWRLTGDRRYAECFVRHLASWMDDNPPKLGINWASSLEVSYRAVAWLWAFRLFEGYVGLAPRLLARARKFLFLHGRHLETYLSTYFSPNTHLTGEALGLVYLAAAFPHWKCAARWQTTGTRILADALGWHVRADGVYFEQASYYHRYTVDIYTHFYLLVRQHRPDLADAIRPKLEALLEHSMWITRPDGTTPYLGDDDGGRLVVLDERPPADFRAALSTGAVLFSRPDFKFVAGEPAEETFWLLGEEGVEALDAPAEPPDELSRGFPHGGYYVMRDGWERASNWLLADCGVHGAMNCGHAHADALSIQLAARGVTVLVDPGTYRYTTSREDRDQFRLIARSQHGQRGRRILVRAVRALLLEPRGLGSTPRVGDPAALRLSRGRARWVRAPGRPGEARPVDPVRSRLLLGGARSPRGGRAPSVRVALPARAGTHASSDR